MKRYVLVVAAALLVLSVPRPAGAQVYVGAMLPSIGFGSDFDGTGYFENGAEYLLVPKVQRNTGWGLVSGYRMGNNLDWEMFIQQTRHDTSFLDALPGRATYLAVGLNVRFYLISRSFFRPFLNLGMDFSFLKAAGASFTDENPIRVGDARYNGIGLFGGGGIALVPVEPILVFAGVEPRFVMFGKAKGVLGESINLKDLTSFAVGLKAGACVRF